MTRNGLVALALFAAGTRAAAGDVRGTVRYAGAAPQLPPLVTRGQNGCAPTLANESILVSNGKLENVVVTVSGAGLREPAPKTVTLDQKGCRFRPHVQAAPAGSTLEIVNGDRMLHNTHGYLGRQTLFNVATALRGQRTSQLLPRAGPVRIKCDVHEWMGAWVMVVDAPYAVVGEDGTFAIEGLPAGSYTVTAWHEKLGEQTARVTVPDGGEVSANFTFGGSGASGGSP